MDSTSDDDVEGVGDPCGICTARVGTNDVALSRCGHVFHLECIDSFGEEMAAVQQKVICPTCHQPLTMVQRSMDSASPRRRASTRRADAAPAEARQRHSCDEALKVMTVTAGRAKRKRKSTTMRIGGEVVLKLNNYTLEDGEPTLTGNTPGGEPAKPKGARSAYTLFSKDSQAAAAGLPFTDRAARLGELWRQAKPETRSKYNALAVKDRARFVKDLAAYEIAREEHAAKVAAAKNSAEQAEWQALQKEDERRKQVAVERAAKRAKMPAVKRQVSDRENVRLAHNAAVVLDREKALEPRKAFVRKHAECLRPFVPAKVLEIMCEAAPKPKCETTKAKPGLSATPSWIKGEMRDYQLEGVSWLLHTYDSGISAILGDEMGLGKTMQTIAFLSSLMELRGVGGPFLVVAPLSVLSSWMTEFRKFCPTMRVQKLHSSDPSERERIRRNILPDIASYDVVVTTYEMVKTAMHGALARIHWQYLVIDEGHVIKNEESQLSIALRKIKFARALLLTGTPLQNNMHELWALLKFLYPDIFTSSAAFDSAFEIGGNGQNVDDDMLSKAHFMLRPFMLRRVKADVEKTVPPKEEIKVFCPLSGMQKFWYKSLLLRQASSLTKGCMAVTEADSEDDSDDEIVTTVAKSTYTQLNNLMMQLRKVCNHPFLFPGTEGDPDDTSLEELIEASGKLCVLEKLLQKLQAGGHRVCLFSQFTSVLNILEDFVRLKAFPYCRLDGSTNRVQRTVDISSFNAPNSPYFLFLMSTRAGGLGINLQSADTCILFDSDWNPQADLQAMARVHRIGQKKVVHVYRLITRGTVEERIIQRAEKKLYLDSMVNRGSTKTSQKLEKLGTKALMEMLTFGADKIMSADEDKLPSDEDIDLLIDRSSASMSDAAVETPSGQASVKKTSRHGPLQIGTTQTAASFNAEMPLLMTQTLQGETIVPSTLKDIGKEWSKAQRKQKSRLKKFGKDSFLHINDYDLGDNFDKEQSGENMATVKPTGRQIPGRDYENEDHCLACWDGGDLVMCDFCPAAFHPTCLGFEDVDEMMLGHKMGFSCPHHQCGVCGRKAAAAGGLLFRCSVCPSAFCEDHLPPDTPIVNRNARFLALGQRHPSQACFVLCSDDCVEHSKTAEVRELENGVDQTVIAGASAGILAGTTNVQAPRHAAQPSAGASTATVAPSSAAISKKSAPILPGRIATNYPSHLYHTVRVLIPAMWKWSQPRPMCRLTLEDSSEHFFQIPEKAHPGRNYWARLPKQYNATTLSTLQEPELRMWLAANASDADVLEQLRNANSIPVEQLVPLAVVAAESSLNSELGLDVADADASASEEEQEPSRRKRRAASTVDSYDVDHLARTNNDTWCERVNGRFNTGKRSSETRDGRQTQQQQEDDTYLHPELIEGAGIRVVESSPTNRLDWEKHYDVAQKRFYWWNKTTHESQWNPPAATATQPAKLPDPKGLDVLVRLEVERNEASRAVQRQLIKAFRAPHSVTQRQLRSELVKLAPSLWRGWVDGTAQIPFKYASLIQTWGLSAILNGTTSAAAVAAAAAAAVAAAPVEVEDDSTSEYEIESESEDEEVERDEKVNAGRAAATAPNVSPDWERYFDSTWKRHYWWNRTTHESSWNVPLATHANGRKTDADEGKKEEKSKWWNSSKTTHESSWKAPSATATYANARKTDADEGKKEEKSYWWHSGKTKYEPSWKAPSAIATHANARKTDADEGKQEKYLVQQPQPQLAASPAASPALGPANEVGSDIQSRQPTQKMPAAMQPPTKQYKRNQVPCVLPLAKIRPMLRAQGLPTVGTKNDLLALLADVSPSEFGKYFD